MIKTAPQPFVTPDDEPLPHIKHDLDTGLPWPKPTVPEPDFVTLAGFLFESVAAATDGCPVEPDSICRHGHPSCASAWFDL